MVEKRFYDIRKETVDEKTLSFTERPEEKRRVPGHVEIIWRRQESNLRQRPYESPALPLSYAAEAKNFNRLGNTTITNP